MARTVPDTPASKVVGQDAIDCLYNYRYLLRIDRSRAPPGKAPDIRTFIIHLAGIAGFDSTITTTPAGNTKTLGSLPHVQARSDLPPRNEPRTMSIRQSARVNCGEMKDRGQFRGGHRPSWERSPSVPPMGHDVCRNRHAGQHDTDLATTGSPAGLASGSDRGRYSGPAPSAAHLAEREFSDPDRGRTRNRELRSLSDRGRVAPPCHRGQGRRNGGRIREKSSGNGHPTTI